MCLFSSSGMTRFLMFLISLLVCGPHSVNSAFMLFLPIMEVFRSSFMCLMLFIVMTSKILLEISLEINVIDQCIRAEAVVIFSVILTVTVWDRYIIGGSNVRTNIRISSGHDVLVKPPHKYYLSVYSKKKRCICCTRRGGGCAR